MQSEKMIWWVNWFRTLAQTNPSKANKHVHRGNPRGSSFYSQSSCTPSSGTTRWYSFNQSLIESETLSINFPVSCIVLIPVSCWIHTFSMKMCVLTYSVSYFEMLNWYLICWAKHLLNDFKLMFEIFWFKLTYSL